MGEAHISLAHQLIIGNRNTTSCVMYHVTLKARNNESINHIYIYIYKYNWMSCLCGTFGGGEDSSHFVRALLGSLKIKCGVVDVMYSPKHGQG